MAVKFKRLKRAPVILALIVLVLVCGVRLLNLDFFDRLERMTYDWRVRDGPEISRAGRDQSRFRRDGRFQHRRHPARIARHDLMDFTGRAIFMAG